MTGFKGCRSLSIGLAALALFWLTSCSPPDRLEHNDDTSPSDQSQVPFRDAASSSATGPARTQPGVTGSNQDLPFRDPQHLPAGTLLTVRLLKPLSTENWDADGTFQATIDRPVVIDGDKLVGVGASVTGRVESARASNFKSNHGYLQLTLTSIELAGLKLPVQTSSLFVSGKAVHAGVPQSLAGANQASRLIIHLEKGRQLVFRLTEPVYVAAGRPTSASR